MLSEVDRYTHTHTHTHTHNVELVQPRVTRSLGCRLETCLAHGASKRTLFGGWAGTPLGSEAAAAAGCAPDTRIALGSAPLASRSLTIGVILTSTARAASRIDRFSVGEAAMSISSLPRPRDCAAQDIEGNQWNQATIRGQGSQGSQGPRQSRAKAVKGQGSQGPKQSRAKAVTANQGNQGNQATGRTDLPEVQRLHGCAEVAEHAEEG